MNAPHTAGNDAPYESAEYYEVQDFADWLHPWLEGRPFCGFSPKALCPHFRRSSQMAEALLCDDGWVEGFVYHRLIARGRVIPPGESAS